MTSETKHTPGPWTIEKSTRTDIHILANKRWIATASNHDFHPTQEENERTVANARLIAAAPDLLVALQAIMDDPDAVDHILHLDAVAADAAIAKATGEG